MLFKHVHNSNDGTANLCNSTDKTENPRKLLKPSHQRPREVLPEHYGQKVRNMRFNEPRREYSQKRCLIRLVLLQVEQKKETVDVSVAQHQLPNITIKSRTFFPLWQKILYKTLIFHQSCHVYLSFSNPCSIGFLLWKLENKSEINQP